METGTISLVCALTTGGVIAKSSVAASTTEISVSFLAFVAAGRVPVDKLEEDIYYLLQLWRTICARRQEITHHQSSELIYQELSLPLRSIRDLVHAGTEKVVIDNTQTYEQIRYFAKEFVPFIYDKIVHYTAEQSLFDVHRVEDDLRDALKRRVDLKSGGYLIIDQTEACCPKCVSINKSATNPITNAIKAPT